MKHPDQRHATRTALLDAAVRLIDREGLQGFTLDAVAKEASVSKGGLFYHFASKQTLVQGMLAASLDAFEAHINDRIIAGRVGGYVEAFVLTTLEAATSALHLHTSVALSAAMAGHPELLDLYAQRSQLWQVRLETDGVDPVRATVARLAADGLFYSHVFGCGEVFQERRQAVVTLLLEQVRTSLDTVPDSL